MNRKLWLSASLTSALILSSCGSSAGSYGDACPILNVHSNEMALVISSVPVAVDYDQRREEITQALGMTSFTDLNSLRMAFNADMNTALGLSGSLKPPTGEAAKIIEDLRTNVYKWDWTSVSSVEEVNAIMEGFAAIDEACSK